MRIAYLVNQYPMVSHSFIRREILALEKLGACVLRVASRGWDAPLFDDADLEERSRTHYLLRGSAVGLAVALIRATAASPMRMLRALGLALRMARQSPRPVLVHLAYLAQACRLLELTRMHQATHVHAHFGTNAAEIAMLCTAVGGPKYSFTVHGPEEFDMPGALHLRDKAERAAFVAVISSFGRSQMYRWVGLRHWPKIRVVHCGIEDGISPVKEEGGAASRMVLCVGRLCEQKGQALLLAAARELGGRGIDFQLVLAGDGDMRPQLERLITAYGLEDRVRITGWISGAEVRSLLAQSRALILPSFAEGLPVVIMEAMAAGRPVITTRVAGIPELVRHGEEGWLVPAGDCHALVHAWLDLLECPQDRLDAMGRSAAARVARRHSAMDSARKLHALFGEPA